ncbi:MAG: hypothetical protein K8I02_11280, partial [Candidatus Methylomirabilis sp.]|nr:hypothetical protein [Deltaproteobacteria bacterium]
MHVLRKKRFSALETLGLVALGAWCVQGIGHALSVPGVAPGQVAKASDVQQIVDAVTALEEKLQYVQVVQGAMDDLAGPHRVFEGVNVHVRSGGGATDDGGSLTGLGNLVVGYNEADAVTPQGRGGSHNLVVGEGHD